VHKEQNGFSVVEGLIIAVIVIVIALIGWHLLNTNSKTNKLLTSSNTQQPTVKLVKLNPQQALRINSSYQLNNSSYDAKLKFDVIAPNVWVFQGAPASLVLWAKRYAAQNAQALQSFALTINYVSKNGNFAHGGTNGSIILIKNKDSWAIIPNAGGQAETDCSVIEAYKIPADILPTCVKYNQISPGQDNYATYENETS